MTNAIVAGVGKVQFFHMPVVKARTDDAYFAPLQNLKRCPETELYLGLVHYNDASGDAARLAAARGHARVDGIGTECGMARGDQRTGAAGRARQGGGERIDSDKKPPRFSVNFLVTGRDAGRRRSPGRCRWPGRTT